MLSDLYIRSFKGNEFLAMRMVNPSEIFKIPAGRCEIKKTYENSLQGNECPVLKEAYVVG